MRELKYSDDKISLLVKAYGEGAIMHYHDPFKEDYMLLHCLLRSVNPTSVFEIGCNEGVGTEIICNAVPSAKVYSLDLPLELSHLSKQHPSSEGKGDDKVGWRCKLPFTLLLGDSMLFDYSKYPCEAYFIDGEHTFVNVRSETKAVLKQNPKIVIFHDADMPEVWDGIVDAIMGREDYELTRVVDTRIAYLKRK